MNERIVNIPLRMIDGKFLSKANRNRLCRANYVMEAIRNIANKSYEDIRIMGPEAAGRLFLADHSHLMRSIRKNDCKTYATAYKHWTAAVSASKRGHESSSLNANSVQTIPIDQEKSDESDSDEKEIIRPEIIMNKQPKINNPKS